jgi:hypothetical protein
MRRRDFITVLGGAAAAWPLAARAQQGDLLRRIGVLMSFDENDPVAKTYGSAFTQALAELGWTDGRNMRMDVRWTGSDINRIRALARELVGLQPDIILASTTPVGIVFPLEIESRRETRSLTNLWESRRFNPSEICSNSVGHPISGVAMCSLRPFIFTMLAAWPIAAHTAPLNPEEAATHVGENATVCGLVSSARYAAQATAAPTFLDFGRAYPNQSFTAIIFGADRTKFGAPEISLSEKQVCVEGKIFLYQGKPEIILRDPKQISGR